MDVKNSFKTFFLGFFAVASLLSGCGLFESNQTFSGGKGSIGNPYLISTIDQLQAIDDPEHLDKHFMQIQDIDASKSAEFQNGSGFNQIGDAESPFTGSYNGAGYTIRNLHINFNVSST